MYFLLTIVGFIAGIFAGLFGIGGGVVIVPSLVLVCGFSLVQACGTSLMALLPPVGILGCIHYRKAGLINLKAAMLIALGLILTISYGAELANSFDCAVLKNCYGVFLLYVSWRFIKPFHLMKTVCHRYGIEILPNINHTHKPGEEKDSWVLLLMIGLVAGIMSGLFGIGGGAVIVPALATIMCYCPKRAAGTSLAVLLPPIGLPGVIKFYQHGNLEIVQSLPVVAGLFVGTLFGARFSVKMHPEVMRILYGFFLLFMGLRYLIY